MSLSITIDLSDRDLEHFAKGREKARQLAAGKSTAEIVQAAVVLLQTAEASEPPEFVRQRLDILDSLIAMVRDEAWALPPEDCDHVRAVLEYFTTATDAIDDSVPVLGYLDDAIMIEICARDLQHELDAYEDFCDFRQREAERRGIKPEAAGRADWLEARREELQDRMHRRNASSRTAGTGYGKSSGYAGTARSSYVGNWKPGVFRLR
jgi:uncharacterized membrane protein YkvA (DUF1232 family)